MDRFLVDGLLSGNLDPALVSRLDEESWLDLVLPAHELKNRFLPLAWKRDDVDCSEDIKPMLTEQSLMFGVLCPVHGPNGRSGYVMFSGRDTPFDPEEIDNLHLACLKSFQQAGEQPTLHGEDPTSLTNRECDCLYWTAAGKTSGEIGIILSISQHTVNHYLTGAIQKLNAINRTQAVVKALRYNLIEFPPVARNSGQIA